MSITIDTIRSQLRRLGWSTGDAAFVTLGGQRLCLVYGRRGNQSFSVQGTTKSRAWVSAGRLAHNLQGDIAEAPAILPFPGRFMADERVA